MKIVYFGSDVFLSCFEYLMENHEILALYTYHNAEDYFNENSIVEMAASKGIPVHYEEIEEDAIRRYFTEEGCDFFFIAEYDKKINIPEDLAGFKGINTHSSLLPEGRSYYPIECAMEKGLSETGVTMHKITNSMDCGDIIMQKKLAVTSDMDSIDVYISNAANALNMLQEILSDFEKAWNSATPQGVVTAYWKRPADETLIVRHDMTVDEALAVFRRNNSMTEVLLKGKKHFVFTMMRGKVDLPKPEISINANRWLYALSDGHIRITVLAKKQKNRK